MGDYTLFELDVDLTDVGNIEANKLESWMKTQPSYWYFEGRKSHGISPCTPVYPHSDHEFFKNERVTWIVSNLKHDASERPAWTLTGNHLSIRTSLKNYDGTVEQFLNWLSPLCIPETVKGFKRGYWGEESLKFREGLIQCD